jgi:hypothetical protein
MQRARFRMSAAMVDAIDAAAAQARLTAPAWVRFIVADHLDMPDSADRQPVERYGGKSPEARELVALRLQLRQLGGLVTQVAKVSRKDGHAAAHADAEETLARIRDAIAVIGTWEAGKEGRR